MFLDRALEQRDALLKVDLAGVDADGVGGLAQRGDGAVGVLLVALADVGQHRRVVGRLAFFLQFLAAAPGAGLGAGGQKDLDGGVGQHDGADVAPVHQDVLPGSQAALRLEQEVPHRAVGRHRRSGHADLLGTDGGADVLAVEVDVLGAPLEPDVEADLRQQRRYRGGVVQVRPLAHGVQADGAVHRAGIHIDKAQVRGQAFGQAGLPCPGGAVDRY